MALRERCTMNVGIRVRLTEIPAALRADLDRLDELWRSGLDRFGGPYLTGKAFCAVDAFFAPVAFRVQTYGLQLSEPAMRYAQHLRDLPEMKSWYDSALQEPWRDPPHEAEAHAAGTLTADLRRSP
jgi:glutathione S-transferase